MTGGVAALERARASYTSAAWEDAYESFSRADESTPLGASDLQLWARSAYMLGRDDDYRRALERAYHAYVESGDSPAGARCAWWIGHNFLFRGEMAPASGWFARGQRLLEQEERDCAERGYLLFPVLLQHMRRDENEAAHEVAAEITEIGERFGDDDLVALGLLQQGQALVRLGRAADGLRLVDETMVAVTAGELSPIVAGIVYCDTIAFCRDVYEVRRAREWTAALTRWCEQQPQMIAHQGLCLVHRAEIMTLGGAWREALEEAQWVSTRFSEGAFNQRAIGHAAYRRGEVHRLRGDYEAAEAAYRESSRLGREPQPGLALLRLAEGHREAAAAAIRRALSETSRQLSRAAMLPAYVEIMVAAGELDEAASASRELEEIGERQKNDALAAMSAHAQGAVELAKGDASSARISLRRAWRAWDDLGAPYEAARARVLAGLACRALGDEETAVLELAAARAIFAELGAAPDLTAVDANLGRRDERATHGLTARELQVLRLVAAGKSNREIAAELVISHHTVRRHVQNIFSKVGVSSRAAATAFAFEHDLV